MSAKAEKELTGRHVLLMLLAFFGVMLMVNIYFTVAAVKTFRGEDVPRSYRQGLEYNQTIAARAQQNQLDWHVQVNQTGSHIILAFQDAEKRPLNYLTIEAKLRHPVDTARDRPITFTADDDGLYKANVEKQAGRWLLVAHARKNEQLFNFEFELWE